MNKRVDSLLQWLTILAATAFCVAAGPCVVPTDTLCADGSKFANGKCASSSTVIPVPTPSSQASPVPEKFAGLGYFPRAGITLIGPNYQFPETFTGGPLEQFTALAVYPATATSLLGSDNTYHDLSGYIVAVGYAQNLSGSIVTLIARFDTYGVLDTSFNGTGYLIGADSGLGGGTPTLLSAVAIDSQGRIVVAGKGLIGNNSTTALNGANWRSIPSTTAGNEVAFVARYLPSGAIDTNFTGPAIPPAQVAPSGSAVSGIAVSPGGNSNCASTTCGYGGYSATKMSEGFNALAIDSSDNIYAAGYTWNGTNHRTLIVNFTYDGTLAYNADTLANQIIVGRNAAKAIFGTITVDEQFTSIALDSSGRVVAVGHNFDRTGATSDQRAIIARFASNLSALDTTAFNAPTGYLVSATPGISGSGDVDVYNSVKLDSTGNIIVGGYTAADAGRTTQSAVLRLITSAGAITTTTTAATNAFGATTAENPILSIAVITATGLTSKVFAAGATTATASQTYRPVLSSWNSALALDTTGFNTASTPTGGLGFQLGPVAATAALGGANTLASTLGESYNAVALSPGQTYVYVAGFSQGPTGCAAATGTICRTFPLLVRYTTAGLLGVD